MYIMLRPISWINLEVHVLETCRKVTGVLLDELSVGKLVLAAVGSLFASFITHSDDRLLPPNGQCHARPMVNATSPVNVEASLHWMSGKWLIKKNCLRWCRTTEMDSQMRVCAIYGIQFTRMNCVWLGNTIEKVQLNKICVIRRRERPCATTAVLVY